MASEKSKFIVLGVLGAALLGVGAWQFMGSGSTEKKKPGEAKESGKSKSDVVADASETASHGEDLTMLGLTRKNPFQPYQLPQDPAEMQDPSEAVKPTEPPPPPPSSGRRLAPKFPAGSFTTPLDPNGGSFVTQPEGGGPPVDPNAFNYSLVGIVEGPNPVAIFEGGGGQKLVRLGGHVDSDSRVVGISNGKVTVRHSGRTLTLSVGGQ